MRSISNTGLRLALAGLLTSVTFASSVSLAQPRRVPPAPVPEAVVMPRPTAAELERAEAALDRFLSGLEAEQRAVFEAYPYLLQVSPRPDVNSALVPNLQPRFEAKHEANKARAAEGGVDVLFMGDSITDFWRNETGRFAGKPVLDEVFGDLRVANFGIAGDTTQGVLYRLDNGKHCRRDRRRHRCRRPVAQESLSGGKDSAARRLPAGCGR
jgi:hypothetical protein